MGLPEAIQAAGPLTVHPCAGLFRRILAYSGLEYSAPICFGLGCALDFALPTPSDLVLPRQAGLVHNRFYPELSHAVGMWFREVWTHTSASFVHYLDLEWADFADKMQPLPIFTQLPGRAGGLLRPVLLINRDKAADRYTFLCGLTGELVHSARAELVAMQLPVFGHAIFHPPLNFLKHGSKFRPLRSSLRFALRRTVHQLTAGYGETGLPALERFHTGIRSGQFSESYLRELARYYLDISRGDLAENGLYRRCFADFLTEVAAVTGVPVFAQAERVYRELAAAWSGLLQLCCGLAGGEITANAFRVSAADRVALIVAEEQRGVSLLADGLAAMAEGGGT